MRCVARSSLFCRLRPWLNRNTCPYPTVEQEVCTSVVALLPTKYVVWTDVGDELVVDAYPGLPWPVVHVAVGVKNVEGIMAA